MSNQWCHLCGGLVDLIGLQPRDVRLCDCKSSRDALRARIAELEGDVAAAHARVATLECAAYKLKEIAADSRTGRDATGALWASSVETIVDAALAGEQPQEGAMQGLTKAAQDVLSERQRQLGAEGWTPQHDDEHSSGELALAAGCYTIFGVFETYQLRPPTCWPWDAKWWKPSDHRRNLVKAAALVLAEIERLDRAALAGKQP